MESEDNGNGSCNEKKGENKTAKKSPRNAALHEMYVNLNKKANILSSEQSNKSMMMQQPMLWPGNSIFPDAASTSSSTMKPSPVPPQKYSSPSLTMPGPGKFGMAMSSGSHCYGPPPGASGLCSQRKSMPPRPFMSFAKESSAPGSSSTYGMSSPQHGHGYDEHTLGNDYPELPSFFNTAHEISQSLNAGVRNMSVQCEKARQKDTSMTPDQCRVVELKRSGKYFLSDDK